MATYAVTARIGRVDPQLTVRHDAGRIDPDALNGGIDPSIDLVEWIWDDRLSERLSRWQERWSQATFYLFDSDSWRR
jgi:hypothetical protein